MSSVKSPAKSGAANESISSGSTSTSNQGKMKIETGETAASKTTSYMQVVTSAFNEAIIDSPSFRSSLNYYHTKVTELQEWLGSTLTFIEDKYSGPTSDFRKVQRVLLRKLLPNPTLLSNGLVSSQSQAPLVAESFQKNYSEFISTLEGVMVLQEDTYSQTLVDLQVGAIEPYLAKKAKFDQCQAAYDKAILQSLAQSSSTSNMKPANLKDEEERIFVLHKEYLEASFTVIWAVVTLRMSLDKFMVELMGQFNKKNVYTFKEDGKKLNLSPVINHHFQSYFRWVKGSMESFKSLHDKMSLTKDAVFRKIIKDASPSDDQKDYVMPDLRQMLKMSPSSYMNRPIRKNGWLLMKTTMPNSSTDIWVKRWCSVENFVFGLFLLSPNRSYVEETDKFGINLVTLQYPVSSNRRFCFSLEIKRRTANVAPMVVTFQAKNSRQLKEWLQAFTRAKLKFNEAIKDKNNKEETECGYKRFSPRFIEFSSSSNTYYDKLLATRDSQTISLIDALKDILKPEQITDTIEQKSQSHKAVSAPAPTQLTPLALLAGPFRLKSHRMFDAIQANIWGLNPLNQYGSISSRPDDPAPEGNYSKPKKIIFPKNYTDELKITYIHFKTLYESINYNFSPKYLSHVNEFVLLKYGFFWSMGQGQTFMAVSFLTKKFIYNYLSAGGLFHLSRLKLSTFKGADYRDSMKDVVVLRGEKNKNIRLDVSQCNYKALASKLQYVIEMNVTNQDKSVDEILSKFNKIDQVFKDIAQKEEIINDQSTNKLIKAEYNLGKTFWTMDPSAEELKNRIYEIKTQHSKSYVRSYNIPSKALLHIMFGDNSTVFPNALFLADKESNYNKCRYWREIQDENGKVELERTIEFKQNRTNNFVTDKDVFISTKQRITEMVENRYYQIEQEPLILDIAFCRPLKLTILYLITESLTSDNDAATKLQLASKSCRLYVHYKLEYLNKGTTCFAEKYVKRLIVTVSDIEFVMLRKSIHYYIEKIGPHGQIAKAIQLGGLLGVAMDDKIKYENNESIPNTEDLQLSDVTVTNDVSSEKTSGDMDVGSGVIGLSNEPRSAKLDPKLLPIKFDNPPTVRYDFALLIRVSLMALIYRSMNAVFILLRLLILGVTLAVQCVKCVNYYLLIGLVVSILINMYLSARSTISYWSVQKANSIFDDALSSTSNAKVNKSITIDDLDILTNYLANSENDIVFGKYKEISRSQQNKFRRTRSEIGNKRNDLLVELKVLQSMEKELVQGDYRSFLMNEIQNCKQVTVEYPLIWEEDEELQKYCNLCREEYNNIGINLV